MSTEYESQQLFQLLDIYMDKYFTFYNNPEPEHKTDCIELTKMLHEILTVDCNFIKVTDLMGDFIDKHLEKTDDIDFVINAYEYLFRDDFFRYLLDISIDEFNDVIKSDYHRCLTMLIMYRHLLCTKYVEEYLDDDFELKKELMEFKLKEVIVIVKNIYDDINIKSIRDEYYIPHKENLMELLRDFDLEEIYVPIEDLL